MSDREKLIELIGSTKYGNGSLVGKNFQQGFIEKIADHLRDHGVTFATDTNVGNKWISVEDRLPTDGVRVLAACDDGIVRLNISKGGFPAVINKQHRFAEVTHWMPLPEAPKET